MFFHFLFLLSLCHSLVVTPFLPASLLSPSINVSSIPSYSDAPDSQCISPGENPSWNGRILYADCERALSNLRAQTASVASDLYAFYTTTGGFRPPHGLPELEWQLPTTVTYSTCMIQLRMFRDFKIDEVPTHEGRRIVPSKFSPAAITTWEALLTEAQGVLRCVRYGWPGWGSEGLKPTAQKPKEYGNIGIFFWGVSSRIAADYKTSVGAAVGESGGLDAVGTA